MRNNQDKFDKKIGWPASSDTDAHPLRQLQAPYDKLDRVAQPRAHRRQGLHPGGNYWHRVL